MAHSWKTIRVFISSTFRDMHAERDYLVRFVFPELRDRCAKRHLHLVDVDLRWGVTEDEAEQGRVLEVCLDEIERCRPFFVGLLGERYGWVPSRYDVSAEPRYDWVREFEAGHSITSVEIYHGVLRNPAMQQRAFFYFRNPSFISDVPEAHRAAFLPENGEARFKLERLKNAIRERCVVRENYACSYGGVDSDGKVLLTGLERFGQQVLEDLWSAIEAESPVEEQPAEPIAIERAYHEAFIEARSQQFIGREDLLARVAAHCDGDEATPFVVVGAPGSGKSALLANFAKRYAAEHADTFVLSHFIGVSPGSTDIRRTLLRLCRELAQQFDLREEIPEDYHELRRRLPAILERSCSQARTVLVVDGLNQLDASHFAHELHWLPQTVPPGLRLILSTLEGDCLDALRRRAPVPQELKVGPLQENERKEIVTLGLGAYRKQLDGYQMELLLTKHESASPLYLMVACEELRVFGEFERVTERIAGLPDEVEELLQQVIERLEQDHGRELVESALSLLECSRNGLLESEMLELLRREGEDQLPQAIWSVLYRSLQFYLRPPDESGEGTLAFFHSQLSKAVKHRYLEGDERRVAAHRRLAELFERKANPGDDGQWVGNYPRSLSELPYHLLEGRSYEELFQTARDERFLIEQSRAFPDEPDQALRTIQSAIEGASRKDDAAAMAEFVLQHARSVAESSEQSPLDALRAGNIERAWKVADMLDAERCALWYLLLAWELRDLNRIEDARTTLARLSQKELPYLNHSPSTPIVGLLCQLTKLDEHTCEPLWARLLNEFDRRVLCGRLIKDNQRAVAFRVANKIENPSESARLLVEVAQAQATAGEFSEAAETAGCIDVERNKAEALSAIAVGLADRDDLDGARRTASQIEDPGNLVRARVAIARAQGRLGLHREAQESVVAAERTAMEIQDARLRARELRKIAVLRAERGELPAARDLFNAALTAVRSGDDDSLVHMAVLDEIAVSLVEAGEAQWAFDVARESDQAFNKLREKANRRHGSGKPGEHWARALEKIATALTKRGEFSFALQAAQNITPQSARIAVLSRIGVEQANHDDLAGARETFEMTTEAALGMTDSLSRAWALNAVSIAQSEAGDITAARRSFAAAISEVPVFGDSSSQRQTEETLTQIVRTQAEAGQAALAVEAAEQIAQAGVRVTVLVGVARARFKAGAPREASLFFEAAERAAQNIAWDEEARTAALRDIAEAQKDPGKEISEADKLRIALNVRPHSDFSYRRNKAITAIVSAQAANGDITGAIRLIERVPDLSNYEGAKAWAAVAIVQAKSGNAEGVAQAIGQIEGWLQTKAAVEAAAALADLNDLEAAERTLALVSQSNDDFDELCWVARQQVEMGALEGARRTLSSAHGVARSDKEKLERIAIMEAEAGSIDDALMLAGWLGRADAFAGISCVQARAGAPEAAFQTVTRVSEWERSKPLCELALVYAAKGEIRLARDTVEAALRNTLGIANAHLRTNALLEVAAAQRQMGEDDAAVETLRAAAVAARAESDAWSRLYGVSGVAVTQAQADDTDGALDTVRRLEQDEEISTIPDRAFYLDNALQALCEAQARAGDTPAALRSARSLSERRGQLRAIVRIAVDRAKARNVQSTRNCLDEAVNLIPPDRGRDRDSALCSLATAQAHAGEFLQGLDFFEEALASARRIEDPRDCASALRSLAEAQANAGEQEAARDNFRAALESARRIDYYSRAEPLGKIAVAQARTGELSTALENVIGFDASEESRVKILCEVAFLAVEMNAGEQALKIADLILTERNTRLPELAARFADANQREHFKRLLIPSAYFTDGSYQMCGLLAKLYPESVAGLAEVFARAINIQNFKET